MAKPMNVEIVVRETIKPSSPTPHHLRNFKLSLLDQLAPELYLPLLLFYPGNGDTSSPDVNDQYHEKTDKISERLKSSLSETLTRFYPFAGRFKDHASIECNDDGAVYVKARVNCLMSHILKQPNADILTKFLPVDVNSKEATTGPLLLVQANFFECGGMAIGLCMSHKITDAATLSTFVKAWVAVAVKSSEAAVFPEFNCASNLQPMDSSSVPPPVEFMKGKCITKRYVFDASKIALLKAKATGGSVQRPTRVEAVTALIWKCAMAASRSNFGVTRLSVLAQAINFRKRTVPPLPENSVGNILGYSPAQTEETKIELQCLVDSLKGGAQDISESLVENWLKGEEMATFICEFVKELGNLSKTNDIDFYIFSSWCKFPFYEADFGWGKPKWVTVPGSGSFKNFVCLSDTAEGDGVEAWVSLGEEEMALFERDQEFLAFATLNPSVY